MLSPTNNINTLYPKTTGHRTLAKISVLSVIALLIVLILESQNILDAIKIMGYTEPPDVATIMQQDTMTNYAAHLIKLNHTQIESSAVFSKQCPNNGGEKTIVLGCYHSGENGIFILKVNDPTLDGVEQVTEAHEMLHAAYERLSSSERNYIDSQLLSYYKNDLTDPRLKQVIDAYKKTEPNDVVNEMHSVFGTEVMHLPPALESYYHKYFSNRQAVAAYAAKYQSVFTTRQQQAAHDKALLTALKQQVDAVEADLSVKLSSINSQQGQLEAEKAKGDINGYNAGVASYNAHIDAYNAEVGQLKNLINQYNALVAAYNSVVLRESQLYKELSGYSNNNPA